MRVLGTVEEHVVLEAPQLPRHVIIARGEEISGGVDGGGLDNVGVALEGVQEFPILNAPHFRRIVVRPRNDVFVVGGDGETLHLALVPFQRPDLFALSTFQTMIALFMLPDTSLLPSLVTATE